MKKNILFSTNSQKVLDFILKYPIRDFLEGEVQKAVKVSRSGINYALRELEAAGFIFRNKRGKSYFYTLNHKNPVIRQLKVLQTIIGIEPLYNKLRGISSKVILFGSSCRGENTSDSDVDLFILSHSKEQIEREVNRFHSKRKIQAVVRSNVKFNEMKQTEPDFYGQVTRGIVLWEAQDESGI